MKTAMQEVKEKFQSGELDPLNFQMWFSANMWRLLEKEKEHLMMAFNDGKTNAVLKKRTSEEYYNQLYE
jgi:hypothetical protein